jgi:hypothetical protein
MTRHAAGHGRCLRRQLCEQATSCTTTTRSAASCTPASGGPDKLAHLQARTAAKAGCRAFHRHPDAAHHPQEPGRLQTDLQSRVLNCRGPAHCRALLRGRGRRVWRRRGQRQALAGRHVFARLHPHGAGGGTRHRQRRLNAAPTCPTHTDPEPHMPTTVTERRTSPHDHAGRCWHRGLLHQPRHQ